MLNLNLLSEKQKRELGYEIFGRMAVFWGAWLSGIGVIFGILLLPAYFFVALQNEEVQRVRIIEEQAEAAAGIKEVERKVRDINQRTDVILAREKKKRDISPFIGEVLSKITSGTSLFFVNYNAASGQAVLTGFAETRHALLNFIADLKKNPRIKNVVSPVGNIIKESAINFSLTLEIEL